MQVIRGFERVPAGNQHAALAIGNFDGVHRGHQALLLELRRHAKRLSVPAGVMLFEPHPRAYFRPSEQHFELTPLDEKLRLLEALELDFAAVLAFDAVLAGMSHDAFIERVLVQAFAVRHVVIGYDFFFGKGRAGTPAILRAAGEAQGFGVTVVEPVAEAGEAFSSSAIRLKLAQGDVRGAANELGHWWRVSGKVVGGAKRGTGLGFPTANLPLHRGTALGHGIYAVRVDFEDRRLAGAAYLGTRPTFDDGAPVLEVFLLDFAGELYGREIAVAFIDFIRADRRFRDVEELKAQMQKDCARARQILAALEADDPMRAFPLSEAGSRA